MWNGILNVCKERGYTSSDVVVKMRRILRMRKIGHAGTLDREASGVLPLLLGNATKISEYLMDHSKTYQAVMLLGVTTSTQDTTGEIVSVRPVAGITPMIVEESAKSFIGGYDQVTPMYSARKVGGSKLYDLARRGVTIERKSVHVTIDSIRIDHSDLPEVYFTVSCSKGTYIRTLCNDIGERVGCGACMKSLVRTRVGPFYIDDSITIEQAERYVQNGNIEEKIIPVEEMFLDFLRVRTVPQANKKLLNGNRLSTEELSLPSRGAGPMIRVCLSGGQFIAVYRFDVQSGLYYPYRMLNTDQR